VPHVTNPFLFAFPTKTMTPGSILLDLWRNPYLLPSLAGFSAISRRLLLARRLSKSVYVFHVKNESSVFVLSLVHCDPLSATGFCFVLIRDAQFAISNGGDDTVYGKRCCKCGQMFRLGNREINNNAIYYLHCTSRRSVLV
jgi:hypothetical protein